MIYSQFNLFDRLHAGHQTCSYGVKNYFRIKDSILAPTKGGKTVNASHRGYHTVGIKHTYSDLHEVDKVTVSPMLSIANDYQRISKVIRTSDPLSSSLTTIRNAYYKSFETCYVSNSKLIQELLSKIVDTGYINSWYFTSTWSVSAAKPSNLKSDPHIDMNSSKQVDQVTNGKYKEPSIIINLKYYQNRPAIRGITQISKPGKRAYFSKQRLLKTSELNNWGENKTLFLTTSQGIFSHHELCLRHTKGARSADNEVNVRSTSQLGGGEALCLVW